MPEIELINVVRRYNANKSNEVLALDHVNLALEKGTSTAIVGVSGCGKTTMLNMIGCVDVPDEGEVKLFGETVDPKNDTARAKLRGDRIGFVLQQLGLLPNDSVYDNIRLPLFYSGKLHRSEWKKRIGDITEELGIGDLLKKKVKELSGGQKQRVAIARALVNDPDIIQADEPTSSLDKGHADEVMSILREFNKSGKTVVVVTHDTRIVHDYDNIIRLDDGRIVS